MKLQDFPDAPLRPGSPYPPATIENVARLLEHHRIRCRYNEVKKKVEVDIPDHIGTADNHDNVTMTHVVSLAARLGMPQGRVPEYVNAIADRHAYNPAADWIDGRAWDGVDRVQAFCATVTAAPDYPAALKDVLLRKWLRSAAAAAINRRYKGRGVLTLQGRQGLGKTSWVKLLVSDTDLADQIVKLDHLLDPSSKDSVIGAISHWIVEIGELDSSFRRDVGRMKGFLTADANRVRRPYDRREAEYRRGTVFVATVNDANFLVDTTGNSRFWTIACDKLDYRHSIDMQQVFAQVATEVRAVEPWVLTAAEEAGLAELNRGHMAVSVIAEQLRDRLDLDLVGFPGLPAMTASETLNLLGYERPSNPQAKECGAALRDLLGEPVRIQGRSCWRVPVKEGTAADLACVPAAVEVKPAAHPRATAPGEIF